MVPPGGGVFEHLLPEGGRESDPEQSGEIESFSWLQFSNQKSCRRYPWRRTPVSAEAAADEQVFGWFSRLFVRGCVVQPGPNFSLIAVSAWAQCRHHRLNWCGNRKCHDLHSDAALQTGDGVKAVILHRCCNSDTDLSALSLQSTPCSPSSSTWWSSPTSPSTLRLSGTLAAKSWSWPRRWYDTELRPERRRFLLLLLLLNTWVYSLNCVGAVRPASIFYLQAAGAFLIQLSEQSYGCCAVSVLPQEDVWAPAAFQRNECEAEIQQNK